MFRECESRIIKWLENSEKALLIYGARQVGKTYLVRKVLNDHHISFFEVNLQENNEIRKAIISSNSAQEISFKLSLFSNVKLKEKESVIFLDEIQLYPDIITKIKFLVDEGKYKYILSGSNLRVELHSINSMPVGYVESFQMYPMNLFEFAKALGVTDHTLSYLKECFNHEVSIDPIIHERMLSIFYYYLICGGMPAVVKKFITGRNLVETRAEQKGIIQQYKADFVKYEHNDKKLKIISIYDSIPPQLNKQNRRFIFTMLNKELKFDRYENSFLWLKEAAVAIPVYIVDELQSPLIMSKATNVFKLFMSDVGLLTSNYPNFVSRDLLNGNIENELNNGALFENYVAQELICSDIIPYYFKNQKIGEIDYLIEYNNQIIPLEVKSGSNYKKHKALDNLLEKFASTINKAYVLSVSNIQVEANITYLPIYLVGLFKEEESVDFEINLDQFINL